MGRRCTICIHAEGAAINAALEANRSLRDIAAQFGVSKTALHRHWQAHMPKQATQPPSRIGTSTATQHGAGLWTHAKWAVVVGGLLILAAVGASSRALEGGVVSDGTVP